MFGNSTDSDFDAVMSLLKSTLESVTDGVLVVDTSGKIVIYNKQFVKMWAIPQNVLDSGDDEKVLDFILDRIKKPKAFIEKIGDLYSHPEHESYDIIEFKDGREFSRYSRSYEVEGKVIGRIWSFCDITHQRRVEQKLNNTENHLQNVCSTMRLACDGIPDLLWVKDTQGKFLFGNKSHAMILTGSSNTEKLIGKKSSFYIKDKNDSDSLKFIKTCENTDAIVLDSKEQGQFSIFGKMNGVNMYLEVFKAPLFDKDNNLIGLVCHGKVVTTDKEDEIEKIKTQNELRESQEKLKLIFDNAPMGLALIDKGGQILEVNDKMLDLLGSPVPDDVRRVNVLTLQSLVESGLASAYERSLNEGIQVDVEYPYESKIKKQSFMRTVINPLHDSSGQVTACLVVTEDVSSRKKVDEALKESEKRFRELFDSLKDLVNIKTWEINSLTKTDEPVNPAPFVAKRTLFDMSKGIERHYIEAALRRTKGKIAPASRMLGISRFTLMRYMGKIGLDKNLFKKSLS